MSVSVVIPATRASVNDLIDSLKYQTLPPDEILVVTNEEIVDDLPRKGDPTLYEVRFTTLDHPIGVGDAGLRRNIGAYLAESELVLFLDDDLIAPRHLVEHAVRIATDDGFCWGHHRYIDFDHYADAALFDLPPEAGRSREAYVNDWHGWQSSYAGNLTIRRDLFWEVGGFDLAYLGHHGSEDQQLGRRLGKQNGYRTWVHEPPFAWHPTVMRWHGTTATNFSGHHRIERTTINGSEFNVCSVCPYRVPIYVEALTLEEEVVIRFSREQFTLLKERI